MSRINDALKRARAIQADRPAVQVETAPVHRTVKVPRSKVTWIAASIIGVLVCMTVGLLLLTKSNRRKAAALATATQTVHPSSPVLPPINARPGKTEAITTPAATPPVVENAIPVQHPEPTSTAGLSVPATLVPAAPPAAPALKLQGILYRPDRPSAFINGRMVSVGDSVGGARVSVITRESATLIVNGVTTVLRLPQ
jgi:hypothetical protein